jgi:hypothetical protein
MTYESFSRSTVFLHVPACMSEARDLPDQRNISGCPRDRHGGPILTQGRHSGARKPDSAEPIV